MTTSADDYPTIDELTIDPAALQRLPETTPTLDALEPTCATTGVTFAADAATSPD